MVTLVDLAMNAWMHELYKVLGLFIPLIVSNCLPLARLEAFAGQVAGAALPARRPVHGPRLHHRADRHRRRTRDQSVPAPLFADASLLFGPPSRPSNCVCCRPTWAC